MKASDLVRFYPTLAARINSLESAIQCADRVHVRGRWVRDLPATVLHTASSDVLWTGGFRLRHNRYVRRGAFAAYHLSDGITTAGAEVFGIVPESTPVLGVPGCSRLLLIVDVDVPEVLDLTLQDIRQRVGVSKADLVRVPDWTTLDALGRPAAYELPQCIGELAYHAGMGGLHYPAARATGGTNLVVFTDRLSRMGGSLRTVNPVTGEERHLS